MVSHLGSKMYITKKSCIVFVVKDVSQNLVLYFYFCLAYFVTGIRFFQQNNMQQ